MIKIKFIPNIVSDVGRLQIELPWSKDKTVKQYVKEARFSLLESRIICSCFKEALTDLEVIVPDETEIIVAPDVQFAAIGAVLYAVFWTYLPVTLAVISIIGSIVMAMTFKKPSTPSFGKTGDGGMDEGSPTYAWEGMQTTQDVGIPIPIVYGRHAVPGNKINEFISTDGDKNYLNSLVCIGQGEVDGVEEFYINDNPYANFSGIDVSYKYGTNDQTMIENFQDLHDINSVSANLLKNVPYVYTSSSTGIEGFELYLTFPNGIYMQDSSSGSIAAWQVSYKVEYKLHADATWTDLGTTIVDVKSRTSVRRIFRKVGLTAGHYDIRVTKLSEDSDFYHVGDMTFESVDEIRTDDLCYPNRALAGVKALATDQLSGTPPNYRFVIRGIKVLMPRITTLPAGAGASVDWEDYYWNPTTSKWLLFSNDSEVYWDGVTYETKWCANPVWCVKDLLTHTRYGLGKHITSSDVDTSLTLEMAKYCEEKVDDGDGGYEKRFRLDCVIDSAGRALDIVAQLASTFRGAVLCSGNKVKIKIDKIDTPVQLFGMGNIVSGSYSEAWKSKRETFNIINVKYSDKEKNYAEEVVSIIDRTSLASGIPPKKKDVRVFTTKQSYAVREGNFVLRNCLYIDRVISFRASISAIACMAFDLISFSHDVPQIGFSGKVRTGSTVNGVVVDREIVIEEGKTYRIMVQFDEDTIETKTVNMPSAVYPRGTLIAVSSPFSQVPNRYDTYSFGEITKEKKDYRIINMRREQDFTVSITAAEYIEAIYTDGELVLPDDNYSALSMEIPPVTNLYLTETIVKTGDGSIEDVIDVWFRKPLAASYKLKRYAKAKIYLSDNGGLSYEYRGETSETSFRIMGGLQDLSSYRVVVTSVTDKGEELAIAVSPYYDITLLGKTAAPSDVTGFEVSQEGNMIRFSWDAVSDVDLARYIIKKGSEWSSGTVIGERVDTTEFLYPVGEIGEVSFMIKAIDTSGNESSAPGIDSIIITPPPEMNFIVAFDLWSKDLRYILSNCSLVQTNHYDVDYDRPAISLTTTKTWEEFEGDYATWELAEAAGINFNTTTEVSGYYEMVEPQDLQAIFDFKVIVDADFANVDGGYVEIYISVSDDGITYSAFEAIDASTTYQGQYVKFKALLTSSDPTHHLYFYGCTIYINAPVTKSSWFRDVLIPIGGKYITFGADFTFPPRVTVQVVNGVIAYPVVNNKTKDGCDIMVYDGAENPIGTAEVDIDAKGY